jgi:hypothetical protein
LQYAAILQSQLLVLYGYVRDVVVVVVCDLMSMCDLMMTGKAKRSDGTQVSEKMDEHRDSRFETEFARAYLGAVLAGFLCLRY